MSVKFVRDLVHIGVVSCHLTTPFETAARLLIDKDIETLVVLDAHGRAVGVLDREGTIEAYTNVAANAQRRQSLTAADVMRTPVPEVPPNIPALTAAQLMIDQGVREMFVMHNKDAATSLRIVGVLSLDKVLEHLVTNE